MSDQKSSVIVQIGREGYQVTINAAGHKFIADEPQPAGDDAGPSPYGLLLASLGACTAMTLRMYADRKQWPLESVVVSLSHTRSHQKDCKDCDERPKMLTEIVRTVKINGKLSVEQRERLIEIAERCPVHRTLTGEVRIETTEVQ